MNFLFLAMLFAQFSGQPIVVPVQNPSFEQLPGGAMTTTKCYDQFIARSGYPNEMPPGWVRTYRDPIWGSTSILRPFASNSCGIPAPPDGSWILFVASSTVSQDTGIKPSSLQQSGAGGNTSLYQMKFWVANSLTVYPGYYEAKVTYGSIDPVTQTVKGHELCSTDGWATQFFTQVTLMCPSPDYLLGQWPDGTAIDPNAHLVISLSHADGWPLLFDSVSLTLSTLTGAPPPPPPPSSFVWTMPGFGHFTFPMAMPPDCSDGTCTILACNTTTNQCVSITPGQTGYLVIQKPNSTTNIATAGP